MMFMERRTLSGILGLSGFLMAVMQSFCVGQTDPDAFKTAMEIYRQATLNSQTVPLANFTNPKIADMIAIAERAEKRIFTPADEELRRLARDLDEKLIELHSNDVGRWIGTQPNMVLMFTKFDTDSLFLSDFSLNARRERLRAACDVLSQYRPDSQGDFDASTNPAANAIMEDAMWIEDMHKKLTERLNLLKKYESEYPANTDWSQYPTLQAAKTARLAMSTEESARREMEAFDAMKREASVKIVDSIFEQERKTTDTYIAGRERLAELERQLMQAEFGRKEIEYAQKKLEQELKADQIEKQMVTQSADAKKQALIEYLTSDRVKNLLQPFCGDGLMEAYSGGRSKRTDSLEPAPMSLGVITRRGALNSNHTSMAGLIVIANAPSNDRGGWPVDDKSYPTAEKNFKNMEGNLVNPYIEAQRILREHGQVLVELGMLRN